MKTSVKWSKVSILTVALLLLVSISLSAALLKAPKDERGYLGVSIERVSTKEKKDLGISHGVRVTEVMRKSAAEKAGLKEDDIILYFNNKKIITTTNLTDAVRATKPEQEVRATILRDKERQDVKVIVGKYSARVFFYGGDGDNYFWSSMSSKGYLGVSLHEMDSDLAAYFKIKKDAGVLILSVTEEGAAEVAGIKSGDVVVQIEGEDIADPGHARTVLDEFEEGDEISVTVMRNGMKKNFKVELKGFGLGETYLREFIKPGRNLDYLWEDGKNFKFDIRSNRLKDGLIEGMIFEEGDEGKLDVKVEKKGSKKNNEKFNIYRTPRSDKLHEITEPKSRNWVSIKNYI